jgi:hypothetical protein
MWDIPLKSRTKPKIYGQSLLLERIIPLHPASYGAQNKLQYCHIYKKLPIAQTVDTAKNIVKL